MVANQADRGSYLHKTKEPTKEYDQQLIIVYQGRLAITAEFDGGPEMVIEYVSKGTIINAHNFLSERPSLTNTKCLTSVSYYYLTVR